MFKRSPSFRISNEKKDNLDKANIVRELPDQERSSSQESRKSLSDKHMVHRRRNAKLLGITFSYIQAMFEQNKDQSATAGVIVKKVRKKKDRN